MRGHNATPAPKRVRRMITFGILGNFPSADVVGGLGFFAVCGGLSPGGKTLLTSCAHVRVNLTAARSRKGAQARTMVRCGFTPPSARVQATWQTGSVCTAIVPHAWPVLHLR